MSIAEHRKQKGLSQMKLSALSGVSRDRITRIECSYVVGTPEELKKLRTAIKKYKGGK